MQWCSNIVVKVNRHKCGTCHEEWCMSVGSLHDKVGDANFDMTWEGKKMMFAIQIANAMAFLHSRLVLHLDLKPENILLSASLQAKIADFGTSCQVERRGDVQDKMVGSPVFMCPEIILGMDYDERADVWSFGILLGVLHTRQMPYVEHGALKVVDLMDAIATQHLRPDLSTASEPLAESLALLIEQCTSNEVEHRPVFEKISYELAGDITSDIVDASNVAMRC